MASISEYIDFAALAKTVQCSCLEYHRSFLFARRSIHGRMVGTRYHAGRASFEPQPEAASSPSQQGQMVTY